MTDRLLLLLVGGFLAFQVLGGKSTKPEDKKAPGADIAPNAGSQAGGGGMYEDFLRQAKNLTESAIGGAVKKAIDQGTNSSGGAGAPTGTAALDPYWTRLMQG